MVAVAPHPDAVGWVAVPDPYPVDGWGGCLVFVALGVARGIGRVYSMRMGTNETQPPTPALDKQSQAINEGSETIGDFLEWLKSHGYVIAEYKENRFIGVEFLEPAHKSTERLLAEYFDVDLDECQRERDALIEWLRTLHA